MSDPPPVPDPQVSVVTPCHNAEPFVGETIEAVLKQTHPAVEHVLVDDASSDGSWAVIERYAQAHPERVRGVRLQENRGASHARKRGAELARGEFLMFLDADDLITPETLEALVAAVRDRPGSVAYCPWVRLREVDGTWRRGPRDVPLPARGADPLRGWLEGIWIPPCAVLWRRDVYEFIGGWDEELTLDDDGDLMLRALAEGAELHCARAGLALYRSHGEQRLTVSQNAFSEPKLRSQMRVYEKLAARLEEQGRLGAYAKPLGLAYQRTARLGFQNAQTEIARECQRLGERYAGPQPVSRTFVGRILDRVLSLERKERLMQALARHGIMTRERKQTLRLRELHRPERHGSR